MAGGPRQVREAGPPVPAPASISRAASPGPSPAPTRRPPGPASCVSVPGAPDRRRGALVPARAGPHAHQRGIIPMPGLMDPHEREEATMGSGQHHETVGARDAPGPALGVAPGAPPPDVVFRVRGVSKVYRMGEVEVHALRSVDLDLYAGELMVLLGASGSGKSTLLNILGGLDTATSGRVWFRDRELTRAGDAELTRFRRDHVGFVFQFYNLIPSLTARENVALVTEIARNPIRPEDALELDRKSVV